MSAARKLKLTPQQYLEHERRAEFKSEYFNGEVFAMAGASRWHVLIVSNVNRVAGTALQNRPYEVYSSDLRVRIPTTGLYTYPDVVIVCGEPQFEDDVLDTLLNPTVLVEILSDSTEAWDRGRKAAHYRRLPSLQEYVLVSQHEPRIEQYRRQPNGDWLLTETADLASEIELTSVGVRLPVAEIYARVQWSAEDRPPAAESTARKP